MIPLLAAALAVSAAPCSTSHLDTCADTNQLILAPSFRAALRVFLGKARGAYLSGDAPMIDQAIEVLHGPPDAPHRLDDGNWLFTACRAHSCPEKGAVALTPGGRIVAFGIVAFNCKPPTTCDDAPSLTIFAPRGAGSERTPAYRAMVSWARTETEKDRKVLSGIVGGHGSLKAVVTREVAAAR